MLTLPRLVAIVGSLLLGLSGCAGCESDALVFVDPASGDLRLRAGSPGLAMDETGGDVGYQGTP